MVPVVEESSSTRFDGLKWWQLTGLVLVFPVMGILVAAIVAFVAVAFFDVRLPQVGMPQISLPSFDPVVVPWWGWLIVGSAGTLVVLIFGVPDKFSVWLVRIENSPWIAAAIGAVLYAIAFLTLGWGWLVVQLEVLSRISIPAWVWTFALIGMLLMIPIGLILLRRYRSK